MAERATANQYAQIGAESTAGTAVTAGKRLLSVGFDLGVKQDTTAEQSQGYKVPTAVQIGKEWAEGKFSGYAGYNDLAYLLSGVLLAATPSTASGESTWTFTPAVRSQDTPKTYTLEVGDPATRFSKVTHTLITDLSLEWTKERLAVSGGFFARQLADASGGTMSSATDVANAVAQPGDVAFYLDTASGSLGTTALTRVIKAKLDISGRWAPAFFASASQDSFETFTEKGLTAKLTLTIAADSTGMGFLTQYRAGSLVYPRLQVTGPTITTNPYRLTVDLATRITKAADPLQDSDGIYAYDLELTTVLDPNWSSGRALQATLVNALSAL